jgi:hypothetical protein
VLKNISTMKKADTLTGKITSRVEKSQSVKNVKGDPVSSNAGSSTNNSSNNEHDHIDAINQVFAELELAYHNQYHKAYGDEGSIRLAKKYWLECLANFTPQLILHATRTVVTSQQYLPSVATIVQACEESMSQYGLPTIHDAYVEACCADHPKAEQDWSHAAVYLAGKATGWFELTNKIEAKIYPLFETNYRRYCQQVIRGEELVIDKQEALPEQVSRKLSQEENKSRMEELRKGLNK